MKSVRLSSSASAYIKSEAAYQRARSLPTVRRFLDHLKLLKKTDRISASRSRQPRGTGSGVLRFAMGEYLVDYEIIGDTVHLLAIRHSAQRAPDLAVDSDEFEDYEVK